MRIRGISYKRIVGSPSDNETIGIIYRNEIIKKYEFIGFEIYSSKFGKKN
jgi:hypothetical protein